MNIEIDDPNSDLITYIFDVDFTMDYQPEVRDPGGNVVEEERHYIEDLKIDSVERIQYNIGDETKTTRCLEQHEISKIFSLLEGKIERAIWNSYRL